MHFQVHGIILLIIKITLFSILSLSSFTLYDQSQQKLAIYNYIYIYIHKKIKLFKNDSYIQKIKVKHAFIFINFYFDAPFLWYLSWPLQRTNPILIAVNSLSADNYEVRRPNASNRAVPRSAPFMGPRTVLLIEEVEMPNWACSSSPFLILRSSKFLQFFYKQQTKLWTRFHSSLLKKKTGNLDANCHFFVKHTCMQSRNLVI